MEAQQKAQGWDSSNPDKVEHAAVGGPQSFEGSGKDMGLVKPPIVSMHPTSQKQGDQVEAKGDKKDFAIIDNANFKLNHHVASHDQFLYPFNDLKPLQGLFIPVERNSTTDKLMATIHKQVDQFRKQNSEVEKDENGDDVMEDVAINQKKRNEDGTIQLDGDKPRLGIKSGFRPKLFGPTFAVKAVVKDDEIGENNKADGDGVLVIRMS